MSYQIIYEAKQSYGGLSPILIIPIIIAIVIAIGTIKAWKSGALSMKIIFSILSIIMLLVFFSITWNELNSRIKVYDPYKKGEYQIVEGKIEKYLPNTDRTQLPDRFEVNDVDFVVPGFNTKWGYPLRQIEGGVLKEGLTVRIQYIHYKFENVIMKLELLESK